MVRFFAKRINQTSGVRRILDFVGTGTYIETPRKHISGVAPIELFG
jgi:hypothetical protein